jgi:hypothetical protein
VRQPPQEPLCNGSFPPPPSPGRPAATAVAAAAAAAVSAPERVAWSGVGDGGSERHPPRGGLRSHKTRLPVKKHRHEAPLAAVAPHQHALLATRAENRAD